MATSSIVIKNRLSVEDFKKQNKTKKLNIVSSDRTGKYYAKSDDDKILASVSKDIDLKAPIEVLHMEDTEEEREWFFVANITEYSEVGAL